jgi:tripartite-type tricarboxylate transporter receptor subunit TctC
MVRSLRLAALLLASAAMSDLASADDFYSKESIMQVVVGSAPGGGYDGAARLVARHLGTYIPGNPKLVVNNMPGASGIKAVNYLYTIAPRDGSVISIFNSAMPYYQALGQSGIQFKTEEFSWIGSLSQAVIVVAVWHTSKVRTLEEAKHTEVLMGALTKGGTMGGYPLLLNATLGTKFKLITGYKGGAEVNLAMQRGEVDGRGGFTWTSLKTTNPDWVNKGQIVPILQVGLKKDADLPNVPLLLDLAQNGEQRQMFNFAGGGVAIDRPFSAPPNIPKERLEVLRHAFDQMVKDTGFLADAAKIQMDIDPLNGDQVAKIVSSIVHTPPDIVQKTGSAMGEGEN